MSHTVRVKTEVRSEECFLRTCKRLNLVHGVGKVETFSGEQEGLWVKPEGWEYPLVFDKKTGNCDFDNYSKLPGTIKSMADLQDGAWGTADAAWKFMREYAKTAAYMSAEETGYSVLSETETPEGVELEIGVYA